MPRKRKQRHQSRGRSHRANHQAKHQGNHQKSHSRSRSRTRQNDFKFKHLTASVQKNRKGFAFLIFDSPDYDDAYVPADQAEALFTGDRVSVTINGRGEVLQLKVIEHRIKEIIGYFSPGFGGVAGHVVYERKKHGDQIPVLKFSPHVSRPKAGEWVRAKLHFQSGGRWPITAEIVAIYGQSIPPEADLEMIKGEFGFEEQHSEAAIQEAKSFGSEISDSETKTEARKDLRKLPFITIDGEDARDFDDAIYVECKSKQKYTLWVAIADVSHYVKEGRVLDREAYQRGTSVYFPERAFHMLPSALSENLCSLKPHVDRLVLVSKIDFEISDHVHREKVEVFKGVIRSHRRTTYLELQKEYEENQKNPKWTYHPHFELYEILKKDRLGRGSLDFELPEIKVICEPNGKVVAIEKRSRKDTHRLIEEFMIAANEAVTEWMRRRSRPFIYRIHDEPSVEALETFSKLARSVGISFDAGALKQTKSPKVFSDLIRALKDHPAEALMNYSLLRAMKQAVYTATFGGHFGLASVGYTHFTSPIRRYPDLVVHRLLTEVIDRQETPPPTDTEKRLEEVAQHCSYRERLAADAERDVIKLKQIRWMQEHLGEEFEGRIQGMNEKGLFVQLNDPFIEGMVSKDGLEDDFYEFNEDRMVFYGRRKKRTFKIGDKVRVQSLKTDLIKRQIDFKLI